MEGGIRGYEEHQKDIYIYVRINCQRGKFNKGLKDGECEDKGVGRAAEGQIKLK